MKAYITKYALTTGIIIANGETTGPNDKYFLAGPFFCGVKDWHRSKADATARFKQMVAMRLHSLQKSVKELQVLGRKGPKFVTQKGEPA